MYIIVYINQGCVNKQAADQVYDLSVHPLPDRHLRKAVLEFPLCFANHERYGLRLVQQAEMRAKNGFQTVEGCEVFAVFLEGADPFFAFRVFAQPGVRRCDQQQAAGVEALVDGFQKLRRAVQAVDQIGGEDQVIAGKNRFEIACIALEEFDFVPAAVEAESAQCAFAEGQQFAFFDARVA